MRVLPARGSFVALACLLFAIPVAAQEAPPELKNKIQQADALLKTRQWEPALKAYREASAMADKKSALAHYGMAKAYQGLRAHKSAADACTEALKHTNGNKPLEVEARNLRGTSNFALG